jgi:hypothetical protein
MANKGSSVRAVHSGERLGQPTDASGPRGFTSAPDSETLMSESQSDHGLPLCYDDLPIEHSVAKLLVECEREGRAVSKIFALQCARARGRGAREDA